MKRAYACNRNCCCMCTQLVHHGCVRMSSLMMATLFVERETDSASDVSELGLQIAWRILECTVLL